MRKSTVVIIIAIVGLAALYAMTGSLPDRAGDEEVQEEASQPEEQIVGRWVSTEDSKYETEFSADGTYTEVYEGEVLDEGPWEILTSLEGRGLDYIPTPEEEALFIRKGMSEGEDLHYQVSEVSENRLVLIYLGRGNILSFTRVEGAEE